MPSYCKHCGKDTRGISFCHVCDKDKVGDLEKGFEDLLKGKIISEKEFKKKHTDFTKNKNS